MNTFVGVHFGSQKNNTVVLEMPTSSPNFPMVYGGDTMLNNRERNLETKIEIGTMADGSQSTIVDFIWLIDERPEDDNGYSLQ